MSSPARSAFPAPPRTERRVLRVLGTEITLLDQVRRKAEADLGFDNPLRGPRLHQLPAPRGDGARGL